MTVRLGHALNGPERAPALVLGGSLGTTRRMWEPQLDAFAERFRVVRYEHRGHGASPAPRGPYRVDDLALDVLALLDDLGIERFSYAGVSLGGMVGLWLAQNAPSRVDRLAVICSSAHPGGARGWLERAEAVRSGGTSPIATAVISRWFTPEWAKAHEADVGRLTDDFCDAMSPEGYAGCCEALASFDVRPGLGGVAAPTLVVAGADDLALPPSHSVAIAEAVPGARLDVVPDAAHLATVERADVCTPLLLDHLGGTS